MKKLIFPLICMAFVYSCIAIKPSERINFNAPDSYPEGIAFDSTRNVYYVSSARTGTIGKVTPEGAYSVLHADSMLKSTYGMKIHPDGKRLFVCVGDANYSKFTSLDTRQKMIRLISIDLASGKRLSDTDLSGLVPGKHFGNDLVFDAKGNIYMTDSYANVIYKITAEGKASVFSKSKKYETKGIGLNGIVYHPAGFLLVDNSNTGQIYKVDIEAPDNVQKVEVDQYFLGADGLLMSGDDKLTVVVNGGNDKIFQLKTDDNFKSAWLSGTTLAADRFTYPSTAVRNGKDIWVMNAKFSELVDSNAVPPKYFAIQLAKIKPLPKMKK
ncbi:gluconolaconase [Dyadobacter subterraneus]|uniref:Gluconolaconase n=1 Tax=Dyadobacter subterraneus TaxID=2773304 RepID=A0ABR9WB13_9BACT|nr:gluconolaconase [Dyadobacter subterraneus]MBE9462671.1 gluconolaconase [Dyadobacter subterraneus]